MNASASTLWFTEVATPHETHQFGVESVLLATRTPFQHIVILDTHEYGKMLVIDDRTQSAEADEYIYHESLVHPVLVAHPAPRSALVIGGGEGATIREVLRHPSIARVVMVDIDRELVEQCEKLLPEWHQGAFDDPRVELRFADGKDVVANTPERFDIVILDVCDALEAGPALPLYTEAFYRTVRARLTDSGLLVVQAMELTGLDHRDHVRVRRTLESVFRHVASYATFIPSFWTPWGFIAASDAVDPSRLTGPEVDRILEQRGLESVLRYYDGQTHAHMFTLPKDVRAVLAGARVDG